MAEMSQKMDELRQKSEMLEKEASISREVMDELFQENKKLKAELRKKQEESKKPAKPSRVAEKSKNFKQQVHHYLIAQQKFEYVAHNSSIIRIQSYYRGIDDEDLCQGVVFIAWFIIL